ncbi:hypothetical protein A2U01_0085945, partial [Trifolium medium]|nr:hypothetical protein [Trifolium medium]
QEINTNAQRNAHLAIPLRSKICSTRTFPFQAAKERGCVRMDRGMRASPSALKKGPVQTSGLIATS